MLATLATAVKSLLAPPTAPNTEAAAALVLATAPHLVDELSLEDELTEMAACLHGASTEELAAAWLAAAN